MALAIMVDKLLVSINYPIKDSIAAKIRSNANMKPYENKEFLISFLPSRILSSSPKLNFFIKIPVPTATAAAGVASFRSHFCMDSKAEFNLLTILGSAAYTCDTKIILKTIKKQIINNNFFFFILSQPF